MYIHWRYAEIPHPWVRVILTGLLAGCWLYYWLPAILSCPVLSSPRKRHASGQTETETDGDPILVTPQGAAEEVNWILNVKLGTYVCSKYVCTYVVDDQRVQGRDLTMISLTRLHYYHDRTAQWSRFAGTGLICLVRKSGCLAIYPMKTSMYYVGDYSGLLCSRFHIGLRSSERYGEADWWWRAGASERRASIHL